MFAIRAVAAGVSQADPFFEEDGTLGKDATGARPARPVGGVQASNSPGLYGGTARGDAPSEPGGGGTGGRGGSTGGGNDGTPGPDRAGGPAPDFGGSARPGTCVVARLKEFLTDPKNSARAREWARVLDIRPDEIPGYVDRLTPVVLRHDTLVTNHAYKHGKAVPFESLLQSGIAVLVDRRGLPAVKCSCGNPLRPSKTDIKKVSVGFKDGNRKWSGFREDRIVVVEPPPGKEPLHRLRLVDVDDPGRGISRPLGTEGEKDTPFDARKGTTVPPVTGLPFAEASERLVRAGLAVSFDGASLPPDGSPVTSSRPAEGSSLEWGGQVTLHVSDPDGDGSPDTPTDTGGLTPTPDRSGTDAGGTGTGETGTGSTTDESSSGATTSGETGAGATTTGETGTGATGTATGDTTAGRTTTGATTGQSTTGQTTTGETGTGATGGPTADRTEGDATGTSTTGQTTSGATSDTGATTTGTGDTATGGSDSTASGGSGGVGDSGSTSAPGAT